MTTVPFVSALLSSTRFSRTAFVIAALTSAPAFAQTGPAVVFETSMGNFTVELDTAAAPLTTANFLRLVDEGYYNDVVVHRVIRHLVVQAGILDADGNIRGLDQPSVENEADNRLHHGRGTIAMARADDPHSASTEFFINIRDNWDYDFRNYTKEGWGYTVFGNVTEGMETVDRIAELRTGRLGPFHDAPQTMVLIYQAYRRPAVP